MKDIGKALAGISSVQDRNNPVIKTKYISPFSEWIKGIVEDCKERTNTKDLYEDTKVRWQK